MTIDQAASFLGVTPNKIRRAVRRGSIKTTGRNSDGAYLVEVDTMRASGAALTAEPAKPPFGVPASLTAEDFLGHVRDESARLQEQLVSLRYIVEEQFLAARDRDVQAWRLREAELERRIAAEREAGDRRVAEARAEMQADVVRARQDAEQARLEREQDRERHRGAELAWMNERRAQLGRVSQLELELERRRGFFARLLRRSR
jgi:hypothetical protein